MTCVALVNLLVVNSRTVELSFVEYYSIYVKFYVVQSTIHKYVINSCSLVLSMLLI